mgnify:CR=1 FL=1
MNRKVENAGPFKTFKEARKIGRELAKYNYSYTAYITKTAEGYIVSQQKDNSFDFYVHRDGRVCKKEEIEKENKKWKRHPEKHEIAIPFVYRQRNREKGENKKEYLRKMAINGACPY